MFLGLESGVWGLGFGVWNMGFGVWGWGFGVWGLMVGVWDLWLGVRPLSHQKKEPHHKWAVTTQCTTILSPKVNLPPHDQQ